MERSDTAPRDIIRLRRGHIAPPRAALVDYDVLLDPTRALVSGVLQRAAARWNGIASD